MNQINHELSLTYTNVVKKLIKLYFFYSFYPDFVQKFVQNRIRIGTRIVYESNTNVVTKNANRKFVWTKSGQ